MPTMSSSSPRYTGRLVCRPRQTRSTTSPIDASALSAAISVRGTIISAAVNSAKWNTRWSICSSSSSRTPACWLAVTSILSSSSEWTRPWPLAAFMPNIRTTAHPMPFSARMNGLNTRRNSSVGLATMQRRLLGILERDRLRGQLAEDDVQRGDDAETRWRRRACGGSRRKSAPASTSNNGSSIDAERRLADPSETEARHRDAELCGRDVLVGILERAPDRPGHPAAFGQQLVDAGLAHRDNRELGRHEKTVGENQCQHCEQANADVEDEAVHGMTPPK